MATRSQRAPLVTLFCGGRAHIQKPWSRAQVVSATGTLTAGATVRDLENRCAAHTTPTGAYSQRPLLGEGSQAPRGNARALSTAEKARRALASGEAGTV